MCCATKHTVITASAAAAAAQAGEAWRPRAAGQLQLRAPASQRPRLLQELHRSGRETQGAQHRQEHEQHS